MIDPKDVTIIIPHLGGAEEAEYAIKQCTISLQETTSSNIIIVQNGNFCSYDPSGELDHPPIHMYITAQGQCKAVNAAAATVNTPWIFVTNDDMIYAPGWWENLCRLGDGPYVNLDLAEDMFCVSPQLVEPRPGAPTFQVQPFGGAGGDFNMKKWLEFAEHSTDAPLRTGFNLPFLIKKELWDLVGGYDINYDPWGSNSDSDLEYKIKLAGVQPYQNTNCIVYHFSQTSGTFNPENGAFYQRNFGVFKEKWGFDRTDDGIWEANFEIPDEGRKFRPWWENFYKPKEPAFRGMKLGETYGE